jgi:outer membrane immunogenic protein
LRREIPLTRLAFAVCAVAIGSASALAADLPARTYTKAPAYVSAIYDWSGLYIGGNAGYGSSRDCRTNLTRAANLGCDDATGAIVGGQIGYRLQSGTFVYGVEAQGDWADLNGSAQNIFNPANRIRSRTDAFGLFTGQVGYAWDNALLYVKGGAAVTDRQFDFIINATGLTGPSSGFVSQWGGTVGTGFEYGFAPNWSAGLEYDHIFEDRHGVAFTFPTGVPVPRAYTSGGDTDLVSARLNYKWGDLGVGK